MGAGLPGATPPGAGLVVVTMGAEFAASWLCSYLVRRKFILGIEKCREVVYTLVSMTSSEIRWLSTAEAARRLGITPRTLYRFIDEGQLPAYRFGRVIRLKEAEVDGFIETCRIQPGTLEHLYPEPVGDQRT